LNPLTWWAVSTCEFDEDAVLIRAGRLREQLFSAGVGSAQIRYRVFFPNVLRWFRRFEPKLDASDQEAVFGVRNAAGKLPLNGASYLHWSDACRGAQSGAANQGG
jgi:hypothetical protein